MFDTAKFLGSVKLHSKQTVSLNSERSLLLLAYLASANEACSRESLIDFLWEDDKRDSFRVMLSRLRKQLPDWLVSTRDTIQLASLVSHDLHAFEKLKKGKLKEKLEALWLIRGEFLSGVYGPTLGAQQWLEQQRLHYFQASLNLIEDLFEQKSQLNLSEQQRLFERWLELSPLSIAAHTSYLSYLVERSTNKNPQLALEAIKKHFEAICAQFEIAVGEPPPELLEHYQTLVARWQQQKENKILDRPVPRNNLPSALTSFVGRKKEITTLENHLLNPDCRLVSIVGVGGCGKTRLVTEAAQLLVKNRFFYDGVFFIALETYSKTEEILHAIAQVLGLKLLSPAPLDELNQLIEGQHLLLILDNFEHLMDAALLPEQLLSFCPNLKIIVTSRERLNVAAEWLVNIDGLSSHLNESSGDPDLSDAEELFYVRAQQQLPHFLPDHQEQTSIQKLCQYLHGSPLGIELAAASLPDYPVGRLLHELEHDLGSLEHPQRGIPERQRSLRAVFEYSWQLLSAGEQFALSRLSIFKGGFTKDAAETVLGISRMTLRQLVAKSFLNYQAGRYQRHILLYQFSHEKFALLKDRADYLHKHASYFATQLETLEQLFESAERAQAMAQFSDEKANFLTCLGWHHEHCHEGIFDILRQLIKFWRLRGEWNEALSWSEEALERIDIVNEKRVWVLLNSSVIYTDLKDKRCFTQAEKALELATDLKNEDLIAHAYLRLGFHYQQWDLLNEARAYYEKSLVLMQKKNNQQGLSMLHNNLGNIYRVEGDYGEAYKHFQTSLKLKRQLGKTQNLPHTLNNLAVLAIELSNLEEAQLLLKETLERWQEQGDIFGIANSYSLLARIALLERRYSEALELAQKSLDISRTLVNSRVTAIAQSHLATALYGLGNQQKARMHYRLALILAQKQHFSEERLEILEDIATHYFGARSALTTLLICDQLRKEQNLPYTPKDSSLLEPLKKRLDLSLSQDEKASAKKEAETLLYGSLEQAIQWVLKQLEAPQQSHNQFSF